MAELTPPSSHNSTPIKSQNEELPTSPSMNLGNLQRPHPLMKSTSMDIDDNLSETDSVPDEEILDVIEGDEIGDNDIDLDDESISSDDFVEVEPDQSKEIEGEGEDKEKGKGKLVGESKDHVGAGKKGKSRAKRSRKQQSKSTGPYPAANRSTRATGGGTKKDGDLWESDIVDRWNIEIGDVCQDNAVSAH